MFFDLQNNAIANIGNRHLKPFPSLQHLFLTRNRITSMGSDLFSGMTSINYIEFIANDVRDVGHDIQLPHDGHISFNLNPGISRQADS